MTTFDYVVIGVAVLGSSAFAIMRIKAFMAGKTSCSCGHECSSAQAGEFEAPCSCAKISGLTDGDLNGKTQ